MDYTYQFLFINAVLFAYYLVMTLRYVIHKDWEKVSSFGVATLLLLWALSTHLNWNQAGGLIGSEVPRP